MHYLIYKKLKEWVVIPIYYVPLL